VLLGVSHEEIPHQARPDAAGGVVARPVVRQVVPGKRAASQPGRQANVRVGSAWCVSCGRWGGNEQRDVRNGSVKVRME